MLTIGFAGTFYTLWDVTSERVDVALGAWYNKVTCTYHKNLSKDLDEAIVKAGTSNFDETLRGKRRSFEYKKPLVLEPKVMTECEQLFRIIFVNDTPNKVKGVRQAAFNRALELGFITKKYGEFRIFDYTVSSNPVIAKTAYKWNCESARFPTNVWHSDTLDITFVGII
jgi:hypothetical protein